MKLANGAISIDTRNVEHRRMLQAIAGAYATTSLTTKRRQTGPAPPGRERISTQPRP